MSERMSEFLSKYARESSDALSVREAVPLTFPTCESCCQRSDTVYRCDSCFNPPIYCADCMKKTHTQSPFHILRRITRNSTYWAPCSLGDLGFVLCLGHGGDPCRLTDPNGARTMTIMHARGICTLPVLFCGCFNPSASLDDPKRTIDLSDLKGKPAAVQLIEAGLWPATWKKPMSAFTIDVMRNFRLLSVQAHTNVHDFMQCIRRLTDEIFPDDVAVRLTARSLKRRY